MLQSRDQSTQLFNIRCLLNRWRIHGLDRLHECLRWLRFAPTYLWMLPFQAVRTAVTYMARQPLFVIKFKDPKRKPQEGSPLHLNDNPQLMLKSTKAVWLWCAASTACVAFAVTANPLLAFVGTAVSLAWLLATRELSKHRFSRGLQEFAGTARYGASPPASRWKRFATWTPAALCCTLGSGYALSSALLSLLGSSPANYRTYGATPFLVTAFLVALALYGAERFFYRHFQLPALQSWYQRMPEAVKRSLQPTLRQRRWRRRFFSSTWRTMPDIASELNTAGTYAALFSEDRMDRPIWRRSRAGILWYFAPLIVPISALTFTPLLMALLPCNGGMDERTKIAYSCGAVVWAAWSFCYFLYFCARDFVEPLRYSSASYGHLQKVLLFDNLRDRKEVEGFFVGSGKAAYDALIVFVPAAFIGFLGLFSAPETKPVAEASICGTFCYDALRQGCESVGLAFSVTADAVFGPAFALYDSMAQNIREFRR